MSSKGKPKIIKKYKVKTISLPEAFKFTKPPLKWVGGKTQLLHQLVSKIPTKMNNYHEIFLGGGSVLLAMLDLKKHGYTKFEKVSAYDLNPSLIYLYKHIQSQSEPLYSELKKLEDQYNKLPFLGEKGRITVDNLQEALTSKCKYYYYCRNIFNISDKDTVASSALLLFLNKTCFRGVYREGPNGFNVPFGNYKNPKFMTKNEILHIHNLIQGVEFKCLAFSESLNLVGQNDFVYLDPPYAPETDNSFTSYTKAGFALNEHIKLFEKIKLIGKKNNFMLSNHSVKLVKDAFMENKYKILEVVARRAINSKSPESTTKEVIITNF